MKHEEQIIDLLFFIIISIICKIRLYNMQNQDIFKNMQKR